MPPPPTPLTAFTTWQFAPVVSAALLVAGGLYGYGIHRVGRRERGRAWPARRTAAFALGLAVIAIATQSSVGVYDDVLFSDHMVQHLLLIMVAPPLLVAGRPVVLLLHATRNSTHTRVKRVVRSRAVTALTWPPSVTVFYAGVVVGTHLTPFMNVVLRDDVVHDLEHAIYLVAGYLYFLPLIGSEPIRWRLAAPGRFLMLLVTMPVDILVGVTLMLSTHERFPAYLHDGRTWGPPPLADLQAGGMIMWIGSDVIMTGLALWLVVVFVRARRRPGTLGGWVDGIRAAALHRGLADTGVTSRTRIAAHTIDSDAAVEAYNAYLSRLAVRPATSTARDHRRLRRIDAAQMANPPADRPQTTTP